jgi:hypothetical protein
VPEIATDQLENQLLKIRHFSRRHGGIGTETHNTLHTIKLAPYGVFVVVGERSGGDQVTLLVDSGTQQINRPATSMRLGLTKNSS